MCSINIRGMCLVVIGDTKLKCTAFAFHFIFMLYNFSFSVRFLVFFHAVSLAAAFSIECTPHSIIINARNESNDFGFRCDFRRGRVDVSARASDATHSVCIAT